MVALAKNQFLGRKKKYYPKIFFFVFLNKAHQTTYLLLIRSISVDLLRKYCNNHKNSNEFYIIFLGHFPEEIGIAIKY